MKLFFSFLFLTLFLSLASCTEENKLVGFDTDKWAADTHGCLNNRITLADELMIRKDEIIGLKASEVNGLLGKPDKIELYKRSQKFMVYSVKPDESCPNYNPDEGVDNITIRFDALGRAKEVVHYQ